MERQPIAGFDRDVGNRAKCQKHGGSVAAVEAVFHGSHQLAPGIAHTEAETRFLAIGAGRGLRPIFIAFMLRAIDGGTYIRPISARYMHRKEIEHYEQAPSPSDD
jgi:uncharacterized DUF497 family protein